ncbi:sulfite reductase subunit alpha [Paenibacillus mucilaginosus]|uniref:assimilatory sulfite reductase (NADPH) n=2 Tax=Paenibacillus mucilaginosus TaxID=61624 RepID=H6NCM3_9BACL|nr:sulfite reductase subunit alpha [Paenibacillus mucilaginosus]AEI40320.1 CysJ [Paenibacillus mucilaginosus KNP414]AFC28952.1 CysJ [Paenibacillus mucilaginosus 3016]MCG7213320.1 sulfite reductase subunit alpha [Paenibacillus mucilaginosus]WDM29526.1 sulfite reductase subunit alpha [Paenibacillus mucilaginosus]WFA17702.1 sulfite reductase subunit alpha [Paenibacillus mucilaginosus]
MQTTITDVTKVPTAFSRTNPFQAKVLKNVNLNGAGSSKETRHIELSLKGSDLSYAPGDCLGVIPENDKELVDALLEEMNWDAEMAVTVNKQDDTIPLKEALLKHVEITLLTKKMVQQAAELTENEELQKLVSNESNQLKEYIAGRDLLDLLRDFGPWKASAQEIVSLLRKMPPRLYSIASSIAANPQEVHLTIGAVRYTAHGRERKGVCSVFCAERLEVGDTLPVFIQQNKHFNLPESHDKDIIMVGPGTGIAPFRSFIQERAVNQATGRSWLFFGDQRSASDFLYQNELEEHLKDGELTRIETAFSRDTAQKVYVQHKMLENSKEIFEWLENGAYFYVCGDKQNMAKDVHNTLLSVIEKEGVMTPEAAEAYLNDMQKQGRYQRDVY